MRFNDHRALEGTHSYLSPSNYHWLNYDAEKFDDVFRNKFASVHGTKLHEFAKSCIELGQKLPKVSKTLNMYVNDCIGFRMTPEVILAYSGYAYGSADAIKYDTKPKRPKLSIFDLKTGVTPASFKQLIIYAAYFCLEYDIKPGEIDIELRIYQNDDIQILEPDIVDVVNAMTKTVDLEFRIQQLRKEVLGD